MSNNNKLTDLWNPINILSVDAATVGSLDLDLIDENNKSTFYSKLLVDPESGISYEEPSPNSFSFKKIPG